jgi:hypothetical protein
MLRCLRRVFGLEQPMQQLISPGQNRFQLGGSEARAVLKKNLLGHCNENLIYVFLFWELRGLSPNVSVSDLLYIFPGSVHIIPAAE